MNWKPNPFVIAGLAMTSAPIVAQAKIYVSIEQAQKIIFPNKVLTKAPILITGDLQDKMRSASSIRHPFQGERIWKASDGGWFIVDEVVGKHEMITYAVGLSPTGSVQSIEILEYVESYGYEVAEANWRKQFVGNCKRRAQTQSRYSKYWWRHLILQTHHGWCETGCHPI